MFLWLMIGAKARVYQEKAVAEGHRACKSHVLRWSGAARLIMFSYGAARLKPNKASLGGLLAHAERAKERGTRKRGIEKERGENSSKFNLTGRDVLQTRWPESCATQAPSDSQIAVKFRGSIADGQ